MQHISTVSNDTPSLLEKLPAGKHAWHNLVRAINTTRRYIHSVNPKSTFVEFEIRFGKLGSRFTPGVPEDVFRRVEQRFDSGRDWASVEPWCNAHVFYHASKIPGDSRTFRTETTFPPHTPGSTRVECTYKELLSNTDYRATPLTTATSVSPCDVRVALNAEHAVPEADVPEIVEPTSVHLKKRKRYLYAPTGHKTPVWCYVLTQRWSGPTFAGAKQAQQTQPGVCEIELECLSPTHLLHNSPEQIAIKLLYKIADILGILVPHYQDASTYMIEPTEGNMLWQRGVHPEAGMRV